MLRLTKKKSVLGPVKVTFS